MYYYNSCCFYYDYYYDYYDYYYYYPAIHFIWSRPKMSMNLLMFSYYFKNEINVMVKTISCL